MVQKFSSPYFIFAQPFKKGFSKTASKLCDAFKQVVRYPYLAESGLKNLSKYHYKATDSSLISNYLLQPIWTKISEFVPRWLAPNLITLSGFFFCLVMYMLNVYYAPKLTEVHPPWLYMLNFLLVLAYQTVDALDGKQARRTQTSSPLGELFDHGCDSFAIFFVLVSTASVLGTGITSYTYIGTIITLLSFYTTQLEDYFTDVLTLGYFDATEGQVIVMILNLVAFFKGPQAFSRVVQVFRPIKLAELSVYMCITTGIFHVARNVWQILSVVKSDELRRRDAYQRLLSVVVFSIVSSVWYFMGFASTPQNFHLYACMLTLAFANLIIQTIVARICQLKVPTMHVLLLVPVFAGYVHSSMGCPIMSSGNAVVVILTFYLVIYLHYVLSVICQITNYLNIECFTTRRTKWSAAKK